MELDEEKYKSKLDIQRKKLEFESKTTYGGKISDLELQVIDLDKQKKDLNKRLNRINNENVELSKEFSKFRKEKEN